MKSGTGYDLPADAYFPCPDGIFGSLGDGGCTLSEVCSMNGLISNASPSQWFRFLTAMGLHGGLIHILMNLSFQVQGGFELEKVWLIKLFSNRIGYGMVEDGIDLSYIGSWWFYVWIQFVGY
jgi:hypothetical protein